MACGKGNVQLSPTEKKIGQSIEHEFLSFEEIVQKTSLPMFKVRSGIRSLLEKDLIVEENGKYKVKKDE